MKKIRLYQTKPGDKIRWMGRSYIIRLKNGKINLRRDELKWNVSFSFGANCQMIVELIKKKEPELVGDCVA